MNPGNPEIFFFSRENKDYYINWAVAIKTSL